MKTRLVVAGVAALTFGGTDAASAYVSANTIDAHATHTNDGARVRATGPIGCTHGERVTITVTVTQAVTGARARESWARRCTGEIQQRKPPRLTALTRLLARSLQARRSISQSRPRRSRRSILRSPCVS